MPIQLGLVDVESDPAGAEHYPDHPQRDLAGAAPVEPPGDQFADAMG